MILFSFFCKDLSIAIIKRDKSYKSARLFFWRERERERERGGGGQFHVRICYEECIFATVANTH